MRIGFKVFIPVLIVAMAAVVFSVLYAYKSLQYSMETAVGDKQLEVTVQTMDKIDRLMYERYQGMQVLVSSKFVQDLLIKNDAISQEDALSRIRRFATYTGPWDNLSIYDASGKSIFSTKQDQKINHLTTDLQDAEAFKQALSGEIYYSDAILYSETGRPTILFAAPIRIESKTDRSVRGVLIGQLSWQIVNDILRSVNNSSVNLYNNNGLLIATGNPKDLNKTFQKRIENASILSKVKSGSSGSIIIGNVVDDTSLVSFTKQLGYLSFAGKNWILTIDIPTKIAFSNIRLTTQNLIIALILAAFFSVLSVMTFGYFVVVRPLNILTNSVRSISSGNLSQRAPIKSNDEIGELARAFNDMATRLQVSYQTLKDQVWERTKQLQEAKTGLEKSVKDRTAELQTTNAQLSNINAHLEEEVAKRTADLKEKLSETQRFNDVMLGREMKIVELKNEIQELKGRLEAKN